MSGARRHWRWHVVIAALWLGGCTVTHVIGAADRPEALDGGPNAPSWGAVTAAALYLPCAATPTLVVNTTADELDAPPELLTDPAAAGPGLSLREALAVAATVALEDTSPWPCTIGFHPAVFPAERPATITLTGPLTVPTGACVDARGRGVALAWAADAAPGALTVQGGLLGGVAVMQPPTSLALNGGVIAGCRLGVDGPAADRRPVPDPLVVVSTDAANGELGDLNVIGGLVRLVVGPNLLSVHGNYLGFDPLAGADLGVARLLELADADAADVTAVNVAIGFNVMAAHAAVLGGTTRAQVALHDNFIGVDAAGRSLGVGLVGLRVGGSPDARVAVYRTVIHGVDTAVTVDEAQQVSLNLNSVSGNARGIVYAEGVPDPTPVILAVTAGHVRGSCGGAGLIEVFADPADQGESFLGTGNCVLGTFDIAVLGPPVGRNVTATLTVMPTSHTSPFSPPVAVP